MAQEGKFGEPFSIAPIQCSEDEHMSSVDQDDVVSNATTDSDHPSEENLDVQTYDDQDELNKEETDLDCWQIFELIMMLACIIPGEVFYWLVLRYESHSL